MQSAKGVKKSGFKCPSLGFSAPLKSKAAVSAEVEEVLQKNIEKESTSADSVSGHDDSSGDNEIETDLQVVLQDSSQKLGNTRDPCIAVHVNDKAETLNIEKKIHVSTAKKNDEKVKKMAKVKSSSKIKELTKPKEKAKLDNNKNKEKTSKQKTNPLPVKSLTDEEYEKIFVAVIENAEKLDIKNWEPKVTSPIKVREPVKKKYSITVGKPLITTESKKEPQQHALEKDGSSAENNVRSETNRDTNSQEKVNAEEAMENNDVENVEEPAGAEEAVDENNNNLQRDPDISPHAQLQEENETTPARNITGNENEPAMHGKKKMKKKKEDKLQPKKLPFQEKDKEMKPNKVRKKESKCLSADINKQERKPQSKTASQGAAFETDMVYESSEKLGKRKAEKLQKVSKRQKMQDRELKLDGTWVQCCNSSCLKWRHLQSIHDPSLVPEKWTCNLNDDVNCNSCDKLEESYDESEHIFTKFTEGSVVWAKMTGYPWWPAMVEIDPDSESYFSVESEDSMLPSHYHVVFFDERVSRAWIKTDHVCQYTGNEEVDGVVHSFTVKGHSYNKEIGSAKKNTDRAMTCSLQERIELFGFAARYKGTWQQKRNAKVKKRPVKGMKPVKTDQTLPAVLDDSTMDDVLDNAEEILENVEDLLESLSSQLIASDEDSEFAPDELVVVEKKKDKRKIGQKSPQVSKKSKKVCFSSGDCLLSHDSDSNCKSLVPDKQNIEDENLKVDNELEATEQTSLKLDMEIFTMEMGEDFEDYKKHLENTSTQGKQISAKQEKQKDMQIIKNKPVKNENNETRKPLSEKQVLLEYKSSNNVQKQDGQSENNVPNSDIKSETGYASHPKQKEKKTKASKDRHTKELNTQAQKENKKVENKDIGSKNEDNNKKIPELTKEKDEAMPKKQRSKKVKVNEQNVGLKLNQLTDSKSVHSESDSVKSYLKSKKENKKETEEAKATLVEKETDPEIPSDNIDGNEECKNQVGIMDKNVSDTDKEAEDSELDLFTDETNKPEEILHANSEAQPVESESKSLNLEESDDEFTVSEQTMYEDAEALKIRERRLTIISEADISGEESDPFDLMEE